MRTWAMRGTMHLIAADDAGWLVPLFEEAVAANSSERLAFFGIDRRAQQRGLREIERALAAEGPLGRDDLVGRLARKGLELDQSTRFHIFRLAVSRGIACLGPDAGGETCLALAREWLGERPAFDREAALRELALRYLRAFGPATEADFAGWAGLGLRDVREALRLASPAVVETKVGGDAAWALKGGGRRFRGSLVRLLPAWDTYLMGYRDRAFLADADDWRTIMPGGGILRPTVLVDGAAVGIWRLRRARGALHVELEPFTELDAATLDAVEREVHDIARFEGASAGRLVGRS